MFKTFLSVIREIHCKLCHNSHFKLKFLKSNFRKRINSNLSLENFSDSLQSVTKFHRGMSNVKNQFD